MKQHIINFQRSGLKEKIKDILNQHGVSSSELEPKKILTKGFFGKLKEEFEDAQASWTAEKWIEYLISKGFWIDSFTSSEWISQVGTHKTNIVIFHYNHS